MLFQLLVIPHLISYQYNLYFWERQLSNLKDFLFYYQRVMACLYLLIQPIRLFMFHVSCGIYFYFLEGEILTQLFCSMLVQQEEHSRVEFGHLAFLSNESRTRYPPMVKGIWLVYQSSKQYDLSLNKIQKMFCWNVFYLILNYLHLLLIHQIFWLFDQSSHSNDLHLKYDHSR